MASVLRQEDVLFEFLVLDDCSTDGSWEFLQQLNDPRLVLKRNVFNRGLFYNLNQLIASSKAPLIKLWAQDDLMNPRCLLEFVTFHREHSSLGFSYCARDIINDKGEIIKKFLHDETPEIISTERHSKIAFRTGSISGNIASLCLVRKALEDVGEFKEYMKISADFDMQVRLARSHDTGFIKKALIRLRDHDQQLSRAPKYYLKHVEEDMEVYRYLLSSVPEKLEKEGRLILRKHKLLFYYTLMLKALFAANFKLARGYFKLLSHFDNFTLLTISYLKRKVFKLS